VIKRRQVSRRRLQFIWGLILLLSVPLSGLYYLAFTEDGLQLIAAALSGHLGPVYIQLQGVSGTLAYGVHVDRLVIDHRRAHIEIENASGKLAILPLAWQTLRVPEVHAARLLVHALSPPDDGREHSPRFLPPLMRIDAEHVDVQRFELIATNGVELDSTAVQATGAVYPDLIRVYLAKLDYNGIAVQTSGEVLATRALGLRGAAHFSSNQPRQPPWTVSAGFQGDLQTLKLNAEFSEPFVAGFNGQVLDLTGAWHWRGYGQVRRLDVAVWGGGTALGLISGGLALQGDRNGFLAHGGLDATGLHAGIIDTDFTGSVAGRVLTVSRLHLRHAASGAVADSQGSVTLAPGGPLLALRGSWTDFRWPLERADADLHSDSGSYSLSGQLPFTVSAQGALRIADLPNVDVQQLQGRLTHDGVDVRQMDVAVLGGRGQLNGWLPWSQTRRWQMQGRFGAISLTQGASRLAGRVGFDLRATGVGFGVENELDVQATGLNGLVQGQRADGHGHVARRRGAWLFDGVRLQLGSTRVALDGHLGAQLDLNFAIDATDLGLLHTGAAGRLNAHGSLHGDLRDPTVMANVQARDLSWDQVRLNRLDALVDFDPHGSGRADSTVQMYGLAAAGTVFEHLAITTAGTTADHTVALDTRAEGLRFEVHGRGRYAAGEWRGQFDRAQLTDSSALQLSLAAPSALTLTADRLQLEPFCLQAADARLCAVAQLDATARRITLTAASLPLRMLTTGLTAATDYEGTLTVRFDAAQGSQTAWHGSLTGQLGDAAIARHFGNGRVETLKLGTGTIDADLNDTDLRANLALDAGGAGSISASLKAHGGSDTGWRDWPLSGELKLETTAIGFVDSFISQIDRASGRLVARLALGGTPEAPEFSGDLHLSDAQLDAYQINLSLRELNFDAQLQDNTLKIKGDANAGSDGQASVEGTLSWLAGVPSGALHLQGTDLRIINIPEARVDASPDVTVHLAGTRIDLSGQITLPYARIQPADLANAVLPSSDEVIVGGRTTSADSAFKVFSHITLVLGDRVTVDTQGLSGRLSGSLSVITDDTGINRGSGELKMEEGKYLAYGRNLNIERGRLLFSNGLLGDPGLDLRAVKTFPDIKAGVNVRGTLRAPRMTFFSDPEVSQSQIVSLLLAGGSLESVQNSADTSNNGSAARSEALTQGGAILAQQIGGRFNIDAGVEEDLTNETSLVLGRYLSPRLYVSYGVGLVEAINTIKARYTIGDHWTIKTEAGTQRSADLVFTIER
jgi:translocation and assembly module TamB